MHNLPIEVLQHPGNGAFAAQLEGIAAEGRIFMIEDTPHLLNHAGTRLLPLIGPEEAGELLLGAGGIFQLTANGNPEPVPVPVTGAWARELGKRFLAACKEPIFPDIGTIVQGPALHLERGRLVAAPQGLNPARRELILNSRLTDRSTWPAVDPAFPHLKRLFSGLLFADEVSHANLLGFTCAMFARTAIEEFPLVIIESPNKSCGKSKTMAALAYLLQGDAARPMINYTANEEEFGKLFGNVVGRPGPQFIGVDNVRPKQGGANRIRSQMLSTSVGQHCMCVRVLYKGAAPIFDPIIVFTTAAGTGVETDLADKAIQISLMRPPGEENHRMLDPHPGLYAREFRLAILGEIFHILDLIELAPLTTSGQRSRFYEFEQIMIRCAAALGMEASLSAERIQTPDTEAKERDNLWRDEFAMGPMPIDKLVDKMESENIRESCERLKAMSRSRKGKRAAYKEYLLNSVHGQSYRFGAQVYKALVADDCLTFVQKVV